MMKIVFLIVLIRNKAAILTSSIKLNFCTTFCMSKFEYFILISINRIEQYPKKVPT